MRMKFLARSMFALTATVLMYGTAVAQTTTLQWGDHLPQCCTMWAGAGQWMAEEVDKRSNGTLKFNIAWGGVLATVSEIPTAIETGVIDIGNIVTPYFPDLLPVNNAIPFFWPNSLNQREVGELMLRWHKEIPGFSKELIRYNVKLLSVRPLSNYGLVCRKPVRTLADFKGMRLRTYGLALPAVAEALGAVSVGMSDVEIYEAFSNGIIDCAAQDIGNHENFKWYEVAKHHTRIPLGASWGHIVAINMDKYNALSDRHKALLEELKVEHLNEVVRRFDIDNAKILKRWKDTGDVEVFDFPEKEFLDVVLKDPKVIGLHEEWKKRAMKAGLSEAEAQRVMDDIMKK